MRYSTFTNMVRVKIVRSCGSMDLVPQKGRETTGIGFMHSSQQPLSLVDHDGHTGDRDRTSSASVLGSTTASPHPGRTTRSCRAGQRQINEIQIILMATTLGVLWGLTTAPAQQLTWHRMDKFSFHHTLGRSKSTLRVSAGLVESIHPATKACGPSPLLPSHASQSLALFCLCGSNGGHYFDQAPSHPRLVSPVLAPPPPPPPPKTPSGLILTCTPAGLMGHRLDGCTPHTTTLADVQTLHATLHRAPTPTGDLLKYYIMARAGLVSIRGLRHSAMHKSRLVGQAPKCSTRAIAFDIIPT